MAAELQNTLTAFEPKGPGVAEYFGVFQRRPGLIVIPLLLMSALGAGVAYLLPPKYESYTRFKVRDPAVARDLVAQAAFIMPHKHIVGTMETDIKNRAFLTPILEKIGLNEGFNLRDPDEQKKFFDYLNENLKINAGVAQAGPDVIDIIYRGRDSRRTADFVNEVFTRWRDDVFTKEYRDGAYALVEKSKKGVEELQRSLTLYNTRYEAFIAEDDAALINAEQERQRERGELSLQIAALEADIKEAEINEKKISDQIAAEPADRQEQNRRPSKKKQEKTTERQRVATQLQAELDRGYTELVPSVRAAMEQLRALDLEIAKLPDEEVESTTVVQNQLHVQLLGERLKISRELDAKRKLLAERRASIANLEQLLGKIPELRAKRDELQTRIADLNSRLTNQNFAFDRANNTWNSVKGKGGDLVNVVEYARPEKKPVFPSVPLFLGIGAGVGLLLGIGLAFLKEFSGMTFSTADQVQSVLPVPVLGEVARIKTEVERRADTRGRLRRWAITVLILAMIATLHVFYFTRSLTQHLPQEIIRLMDKVYAGS